MVVMGAPGHRPTDGRAVLVTHTAFGDCVRAGAVSAIAAMEAKEPVELRRAAEMPLRFWAFGDEETGVRLETVEVTGRRLDRSEEAWT